MDYTVIYHVNIACVGLGGGGGEGNARELSIQLCHFTAFTLNSSTSDHVSLQHQ